jgi:predicted ribosome quality control (RQC) complex YloA/Tae2 family protein
VQQVDLTTLRALKHELSVHWIPARLEQVYQCDRFTIKLALRTLQQRGWLTLCWHPQAARLGIGSAPPRLPDTFTFSQQLLHQLNGLALVAIEQVAPWERVIDLQFAQRPQEPAQWHLYVEIMGKYSNVILTTADQILVTAAHQVTPQQSRVRTIQTGKLYELPPKLLGPTPSWQEPQEQWRDRLTLIPGSLQSTLPKVYRGLSSVLTLELLTAAELEPTRTTDSLTPPEWDTLFQVWRRWLAVLEKHTFIPCWLARGGYSVLGWDCKAPVPSVQVLVEEYYTTQLNQQHFQHLRQQLLQKLQSLLTKLQTKAKLFREQQAASDQAEQQRQQADLLMAHLHRWQPGMTQITLPDFATEQPVTIPLNPEQNAVQNAQSLYKKHQKLKRSRQHIEPLRSAVEQEIAYLTQVKAAVEALEQLQQGEDLHVLIEIREELIQQQYLREPGYQSVSQSQGQSDFYRYHSPGGWELLVGRNNRQNEHLSFRVAGSYDLWFHAQEIPGSHVLLRLDPGAHPGEADLAFAANMAAFYSQARHSTQVPVVWTQPQHLYKPKGAKPGMVVYKHERILWGNPAAITLE